MQSPTSRTWTAALGAAALLALAPGLAAAQATSPAGRLLASNCFQCHGTNGKGPGFDKLASKSAIDFNDMVNKASELIRNGSYKKKIQVYTGR